MDFDDLIETFEEKDDAFLLRIDEDLDFAFALSLQEDFNGEATKNTFKPEIFTNKASTSSAKPLGIVDGQWELIDPNPDIHALFLQFNKRFFYGKLEGVELRWSPKMTLCAGVCSYEGRGGLCSVRLSLPLLKLRPRKDLVETLLHEMIHAYLFVTANNKDHDAHGPEFHSHMNRINKEAGTRISVFHSFYDEVDLYRKHWWKCNGPCQKKRPFYGLVKRAMNRAPGPKDPWWTQHLATCGGTFVKFKEPEDYKKKPTKRKSEQENKDPKQVRGIKSFFDPQSSKATSQGSSNATKKSKTANVHTIKSIFEKEDNLGQVVPGPNTPKIDLFSGSGFKLGSTSSANPNSFLRSLHMERLNPTTVRQKSSAGASKSNVAVKSNVISKNTIVKSGDPTRIPKLIQGTMDSFVVSPAKAPKIESKPKLIVIEDSISKVACPVCTEMVQRTEINGHLDRCLGE